MSQCQWEEMWSKEGIEAYPIIQDEQTLGTWLEGIEQRIEEHTIDYISHMHQMKIVHIRDPLSKN